MGQPDRRALPGRSAAQVRARIRRFIAASPLPLRVLLIAALCVLAVVLAGPLIIAALIFAPYAVWTQDRSAAASAAVAVWGLALVSVFAGGAGGQAKYGLIALAPVAAIVASIGTLGRWQVPCRTTAWALAWSLPVGIAVLRLVRDEPAAGPALAWLIAAIVLSWRFVEALEARRQHDGSLDTRSVLAAPPLTVATVGPLSAGQPARPGQFDPAGYPSPVSAP